MQGKNVVTLKDILTTPPIVPRKRMVYTTEQSLVLGLTLASSFLQLYSTPWLSERWCSRDIFLMHSDPSTSTSLDIEHPYVSQTYSTCSASLQPPATEDSDRLIALCIVLLEIACKEPVEDRRQPEDHCSNPSTTDLMTAKRWIKEEKGNMQPAFYQAASFCMGCYSNVNANLQDANVQQEVVEQIVIPLQRDLKMFQAI